MELTFILGVERKRGGAETYNRQSIYVMQRLQKGLCMKSWLLLIILYLLCGGINMNDTSEYNRDAEGLKITVHW